MNWRSDIGRIIDVLLHHCCFCVQLFAAKIIKANYYYFIYTDLKSRRVQYISEDEQLSSRASSFRVQLKCNSQHNTQTDMLLNALQGIILHIQSYVRNTFPLVIHL